MKRTSKERIETKIIKSPRGKLFFADEFDGYGTPENVWKVLSRLETEGLITRLAQGIYLKPKVDPILGVIYPNTEEIAKVIAKRDKARIVPTGILALYQLGLTTQIPLKSVYLTDGSQRIVKIGNRTIQFKNAAPKNLAVKDKLLHLIVQSFREVGQKNIDDSFRKKIQNTILRLDEQVLDNQLKYAPVWIRKEILNLYNLNNHVD